MSQIIPERMTADIEGDFVVFLIGIRINRFWKPHKWLPPLLAMPRMLKELSKLPREDTGFLGVQMFGMGGMAQYWRSFEHLESFARDADRTHVPAWSAFNRMVKSGAGDVGIWHETYLVKAGQYETLYSGMPRFGLGKAAQIVPATASRSQARARLGREDG